jgi:hypothetical protein
MLEHYHGRLILYLCKLGYSNSLYPFESFKKDFDDCYAFGYITGTFLSQVRITKNKDSMSIKPRFLFVNKIQGFISNAALFFAQVFFSEKAAEAGGTMDVDDCQTEEEMKKKMETYDKLLLNEADGNVPLQQRLIGLAEEAIERGLI